ncbi:MAG: sigma-E factor negative regulatory protein [Gammaproteobacteria bacterium]|nr:sigma-E factor negative regulatory protein [Gammaproteobacteria bacterium]
MTESEQSLNESLSAAIDGEAEELELRRVLNAVDENPDLRAKWQRLHLIGGVLRRETPPVVRSPLPTWPADIETGAADDHAAGERAAPGPTPEPESRRLGGRWLAPVGGAALAAAAALVVVFYFGPDEPTGTEPVVADGSQPPAHGLANVPTELDLERANAYIYQHARGTSIAARPAAMPFVKELSTAPVAPQREDPDNRTGRAASQQRQ